MNVYRLLHFAVLAMAAGLGGGIGYFLASSYPPPPASLPDTLTVRIHVASGAEYRAENDFDRWELQEKLVDEVHSALGSGPWDLEPLGRQYESRTVATIAYSVAGGRGVELKSEVLRATTEFIASHYWLDHLISSTGIEVAEAIQPPPQPPASEELKVLGSAIGGLLLMFAVSIVRIFVKIFFEER